MSENERLGMDEKEIKTVWRGGESKMREQRRGQFESPCI
jgi:hypothetical protein